jgi:hypothetical protein
MTAKTTTTSPLFSDHIVEEALTMTLIVANPNTEMIPSNAEMITHFVAAAPMGVAFLMVDGADGALFFLKVCENGTNKDSIAFDEKNVPTMKPHDAGGSQSLLLPCCHRHLSSWKPLCG